MGVHAKKGEKGIETSSALHFYLALKSNWVSTPTYYRLLWPYLPYLPYLTVPAVPTIVFTIVPYLHILDVHLICIS